MATLATATLANGVGPTLYNLIQSFHYLSIKWANRNLFFFFFLTFFGEKSFLLINNNNFIHHENVAFQFILFLFVELVINDRTVK